MQLQPQLMRKGRKLDQVISGAREVFFRDGFESASMEDIARSAGVSKATLYSYFPDKAALFMEVASTAVADHTAKMVETVDIDAPVRDVLLCTGKSMTAFMLSDLGRRVFRICVAESDRFPDLGRRFYSAGPAFIRGQLIEYLTCAVSRGELAIEDIELAADQFPELCKADMFPRLVFGIDDVFSEQEIDRVVAGAVETFMARYGT